MIRRESTRLVREPLPFRDGVGYAGLVAAYKRELDVLWHRLALENRRCLGRQTTATSGRLQRGAERLRWSWWNVTRRPSSCRYRFSFGRGTWPSVAGCIGSGMPFGQLRRPRPITVQVASSEARGSLGRSGPSDVTPPRRRTSRTRFAYAVPSGPTIEPVVRRGRRGGRRRGGHDNLSGKATA